MKRVISLFVVLTMLLSLVVVAIPASSAATLDKSNVGIEIPYYSGKAYFREIGGQFTKQEYNGDDEYEMEIHEIIDGTEKTGSHVIILDGAINSKYTGKGVRTGEYDEWGKPLFTITSKEAAQMGTSVPSAENTYYWHVKENENGLSGVSYEQGMKTSVWLAWDEDYLYVAAQVFDPDGNSLDNLGEDIWNGDALQIRVDPEGPNSIVGGEGYDASVNEYPWASTVRNGASETYGGKVMNMGIGITTAGKVDLYDMAPRYTPAMEDVVDPDTAETVKGLVWHQNGAYGMADDYPMNPFGDAFGSVAMFNERTTVNGAANNKACTTDYEVAIPWAYMNGSYVEWNEATQKSTLHIVDELPQAGDEFGIAIAILNAARGGSGYNSWLTWGSGVCGGQMSSGDYMTAGGSNSMVLSSAELGTITSNGSAMHEHDFSTPTCDAPYVCQTCGYEKGFAVGHDYSHEVLAVPTATSDGRIKSTCSFCNAVVETVVPKGSATVWHEFNKETNNKDVYGTEWSSSGWNYLFFEDAPDGTDDESRPIFRGPDEGERAGQQKNTVEYYDGKTVIDLSSRKPGTYYDTVSKYRDFAYSMDIRITGLVIDEEGNSHYPDGLYYQFGGTIPTANGNTYGIRYAAGFFPDAPGSTKGVFAIYDAPGGMTHEKIEDGSTFALAVSDEIDLGTDWHNFTLGFDPKSCTVILYLDGEALIGAWDEHLSMNNEEQALLFRRIDVSCMITDMKIGTYTAFNEAEEPEPTGYTVTYDGTVLGTFEEGETVTLPVPGVVGTSRFFTWNVTSGDTEVVRSEYSADNGTANGRTYTLVMPAGNVELASEYVVIGDADGNGTTNAADYRTLKLVISVGSDDAKILESSDIDGDGILTTRDSLRCRQIVSGAYTPAK